MKTYKLIIDFEFTGIDNSVIKDNEIISMSVFNIDTKKKWNYIFNSVKENELGSKLVNWIENSDQIWKEKFSKKLFADIVREYCNSEEWFNKEDKLILYGFWISTDIKMISKYFDIEQFYNFEYKDIQDLLRISNSKDIRWENIEYSMAINWCSLETTYYLVTWKKLQNHKWTNEVEAIYNIYKKAWISWVKEETFYKYVPFGVYKWLLISEYVKKYKQNAEWYMKSNKDRLSESIKEFI